MILSCKSNYCSLPRASKGEAEAMDALWTCLIPVFAALNSIYKAILHKVYGHCELARVCRKGLHSSAMTVSFSRSLKRSKQLKTFRTIIFFPQPFSVKSALENFVTLKKIDQARNHLVIANMRLCLSSLRFVNLVIAQIEKAQKTVFSHKDTSHHTSMT